MEENKELQVQEQAEEKQVGNEEVNKAESNSDIIDRLDSKISKLEDSLTKVNSEKEKQRLEDKINFEKQLKANQEALVKLESDLQTKAQAEALNSKRQEFLAKGISENFVDDLVVLTKDKNDVEVEEIVQRYSNFAQGSTNITNSRSEQSEQNSYESIQERARKKKWF